MSLERKALDFRLREPPRGLKSCQYCLALGVALLMMVIILLSNTMRIGIGSNTQYRLPHCKYLSGINFQPKYAIELKVTKNNLPWAKKSSISILTTETYAQVRKEGMDN